MNKTFIYEKIFQVRKYFQFFFWVITNLGDSNEKTDLKLGIYVKN